MSSTKKRPYFFNNETKQSSWDAPQELSATEISQLPGVEHLKGGKSSDRSHEDQVRASHLLIKHSGSRRPSSWKEVGQYIDHYHLQNNTLLRKRYRQISLVRKKMPLKSCEAMKQRLMGPPTNSRNWRRYTLIAPLTNMVVTLAGSGAVRCRNHLRMLLMDWKLGRSVM